MEELSRDFDEISAEKFILDVSEEVLDKSNWKSLFDFSEQVVKAMKLIALQDDILKSKQWKCSPPPLPPLTRLLLAFNRQGDWVLCVRAGVLELQDLSAAEQQSDGERPSRVVKREQDDHNGRSKARWVQRKSLPIPEWDEDADPIDKSRYLAKNQRKTRTI